MKLAFLTTILINFGKFLTILKCSLELNFEFNVDADNCMSSSFYVVDFYKSQD